MVSSISQGARPVSDLVTKFDGYPGLEQFTVEINNYAVASGNYFYFDLPFTPSLFPPGADQRALPLFIAHRSEHNIRTEIDMPSGFHHLVMAPKLLTLEAPAGTGKATISVDNRDGKCIIAHDLETWPGIVDPKEYAGLLDTEATLEKKSSRLFLLEKGIAP